MLRQAFSFQAFHASKLQEPTRFFTDSIRLVQAARPLALGSVGAPARCPNLQAVQFLAARQSGCRLAHVGLQGRHGALNPTFQNGVYIDSFPNACYRSLPEHSLFFFDCLIVYDLSSSRRWTGISAEMENTNGYARDKENAFLVVSGPDDTALGGVF